MNERRIFARIKIKMPIKFLNLANNKKGKAETVDISANGVGFITKEALSPKTPLEMWLVIPDHHEPFYTKGEVVWSNVLGTDKQRVGVQLEKENFIGVARVMWNKQQTE